MFENQLKKLIAEKEKAKAFSGIDFKNLSKQKQEDMLKAGMASMGKKYTPTSGADKGPAKNTMVNQHSRGSKFRKS